ncbi:nucleosome assembly protein 1-like 1 [Centruroides vittatus]|uniref:nucleosome assembly protein 1-like 1 n=1 Tax=Centruroides vittatus TaxID=120091 RepID=UPI00350EA85B
MSEENCTRVHDISTISKEMELDAIAVQALDKKVKDKSIGCYLSNVLRDATPDVKNSILELINLQVRYFNSKMNYYKELHQLEMKYADIYKPLFEIRFEIINGQPSLDIKEEMEEENVLSPMIEKRDKLVLKHLKDVTVKYVSDNRLDFVLEFHFEPKEYFSIPVLTKEYRIKCEVDPEEPFHFVRPKIVEYEGCDIDWKEGKNITRSAVK